MNNIILPKCPICKRTKLVQLCLNCMAKEIKKARQEEHFVNDFIGLKKLQFSKMVSQFILILIKM